MDLCHLGPLMAVYISIYMRTWEGRGDGARTRSPGQICPGWLTSPPPPPPPSPPTWMLLLNTEKFLICTACQGGQRQPVLSAPSAPAFSRLPAMPGSLLHRYLFIAATIVFPDSRGRGRVYSQKTRSNSAFYTAACNCAPGGSALRGTSAPEKTLTWVQVSRFQSMKADNDTIPGSAGGDFQSPDRNKMETNGCLAA